MGTPKTIFYIIYGHYIGLLNRGHPRNKDKPFKSGVFDGVDCQSIRQYTASVGGGHPPNDCRLTCKHVYNMIAPHLSMHEREKAMQKVLFQRCRKCGHVFHDEHNLATITEWGLCVRDNADNDRRDHVMGEILDDQKAEAELYLEA